MPHMHRTSIQQIRDALHQIQIRSGDNLLVHSNLAPFGIIENIKNRSDLCQLLIEEITSLIGSHGTLIFPTFTYSFGKDEVFMPHKSTSICGMLSDHTIFDQRFTRTLDPSLSVCSYGPLTPKLITLNHRKPYSEHGVFKFFLDHDFKILALNRQPVSTLMHYSEFIFGVKYRFLKSFKGSILANDNTLVPYSSELFVRDLSVNNTPNFDLLAQQLRESGDSIYADIGNGFASICSSSANHMMALKMLESSCSSLII